MVYLLSVFKQYFQSQKVEIYLWAISPFFFENNSNNHLAQWVTNILNNLYEVIIDMYYITIVNLYEKKIHTFEQYHADKRSSDKFSNYITLIILTMSWL